MLSSTHAFSWASIRARRPGEHLKVAGWERLVVPISPDAAASEAFWLIQVLLWSRKLLEDALHLVS